MANEKDDPKRSGNDTIRDGMKNPQSPGEARDSGGAGQKGVTDRGSTERK